MYHPPWNWPLIPLAHKWTRFLWNLGFISWLFLPIDTGGTRLQRASEHFQVVAFYFHQLWQHWLQQPPGFSMCSNPTTDILLVWSPLFTLQNSLFPLCFLLALTWANNFLYRNTFRSLAGIRSGFVKILQSLYSSFTFFHFSHSSRVFCQVMFCLHFCSENNICSKA